MSDLQKEREIPVLTVWKKKAIPNNIFLINTPPSPNNDGDDDQELYEETLLACRHPDYDIRLEHPSISRSHFRFHSLPSSKLLFLTDLNSVYGTFLSGKRIEPNIRTMVKEGDELIGASSRVYKLHWSPFSQAYAVSQPFVPSLDFQDAHEEEDETIKNENLLRLKNEEVDRLDYISDDCLKGLESIDICEVDDVDDTVAGNLVPQTPQQPQKPLLVKEKGLPLREVDFECLESLCLDDISLELELQRMLMATLLKNE